MKRLSRDRAILFICDIQQKFSPKSYSYEGAIQASTMMLRSANILGIPTITTEHNAKAFGETCKQLKQHFSEGNQIFPKTKFSMIIPEVQNLMEKHKPRNQAILVGMETHVCILQTCLDLMERNYEVYILADAVTSLRAWERTIALRRMEKEGAVLTTFESSVFDLLKDSKDEKFKEILKVIKEYSRANAIDHL